MAVLKAGTKIHVEFDGVVVDEHLYSESTQLVVDAQNYHHYLFLNKLLNWQVFTVVEPTDWEKHGGPQVGDIWEADGKEFIVFGTDLISQIDGYEGCVPFLSDRFKALNPRLVRRRGADLG